MNLVISEYSSGFSDYSYILCNELAKDKEINNITYLTDTNNFYLNNINPKVMSIKLYKSFVADAQHKKGGIRWLMNRIFITFHNCVKRNSFLLKRKPDAVLIQATLAVFDCHFLKQLKKRMKVFLVVHDVIVPTDSLSWSMRSLKKMYNNADVLIVHSNTNKNQLIDIFKIEESKIQVIPHGVKDSYPKRDKQACKNQLNITDDDPVLLFYGGIRKSKGLDVLIKALKEIKCNLIIAGATLYGESFDNYKKLIQENDIKTIEFIEFTDDSFRDVLFQASDYLVLPYKEFYSQSGVFMQAIQYHLPIIATDVSSFKEFIAKYEIGFVAKPNNVNDLHKVIKEAFEQKNDYETRMLKAVSENCWEMAGRMYANILKAERRS